jgi:uncharacterized membrane protein
VPAAGWWRLVLLGALSLGALGARLAGWPAAALLLGAGVPAAAVAPRLPAVGQVALALGMAGFGVLALLWPALPGQALRLLPVLGTVLLCGHSGATLRPGHEPLISRYTRHDFGHLPPECDRYTRGLTLLWTVVFALLAGLQALLLATGAPAGPVLFGSAIAMLLLFLGEHVVRSLRFPQFGIATPLRTGRAILAASRAMPSARHG